MNKLHFPSRRVCFEPPKTGIVTPKDAATLMIYRAQGSRYEVLMGKRASKSRFMPDVFVFPGGMVDAEDQYAQPASKARESEVAHLGAESFANRTEQLMLTAVRETYEETGLLVASPAQKTQPEHETWKQFESFGVAPELSELRYVCEAVTPAEQPMRFHARFFALDGQHIDGLVNETPKSNGELVDIQWVDVFNHASIPTHAVTRFVLMQLAGWLLSENPDWIGNRSYTQVNGIPTITERVGELDA